MTFFNYLFQVNLFLALFIGFYWLVLRKETFFSSNRIYLNASVLFSFAIPFIQSEWFQNLFITEQVRQVTYAMPVSVIYDPVPIGDTTEAPVFNWAFGIAAVYLTGVLIFLGRFALQLLLLKKQLNAPAKGAYSFFGKLFIDETLPEKQVIALHENVHIRQWHSLDVILIEMMTILNWFNPIAHLYRKEIKHIHEFIADEESCGNDKQNYALLLLSQTLGVAPHQLTNSFFNQSLLKRRITMLSKSRSNRIGLLKYGLCAPLFAAMLIFSSATVSKTASFELPEILDEQTLQIDETKSQPEIAALNKHLARNVKYPAEARRANENGYVLASFKIEDGRTSDVTIIKDADSRFAGEVKRTLESFDASKIEAGTYSIAVAFQIAGSKSEFKLPKKEDTQGTTFLGEIVVLGYGSNQISPPPPPQDPKDGSKTSIKLDGAPAFGKKPLYVVDGKVIKKEVNKETIDPNTIASVNVLKGNPAVAKYGKDGANGAIEITTKNVSNKTSQPGADIKMREVVVSGSKTDAAMEQVGGYQNGKVLDFASVEVLPKFPGGDKGFGQFLTNTIQYPAAAKANNITGRVIVTFVVAKDGSLKDIKVLRGLGYGTDEEAVRVLELSPKWSPGMQNGKPVNVQYTIPIFFHLPKKVEE